MFLLILGGTLPYYRCLISVQFFFLLVIIFDFFSILELYSYFCLSHFAPGTAESEAPQYKIILSRYHGNNQDFT